MDYQEMDSYNGKHRLCRDEFASFISSSLVGGGGINAKCFGLLIYGTSSPYLNMKLKLLVSVTFLSLM
jgi:hypothetical protein